MFKSLVMICHVERDMMKLELAHCVGTISTEKTGHSLFGYFGLIVMKQQTSLRMSLMFLRVLKFFSDKRWFELLIGT